MAAGSVARSDAIDREIDDLGVFGLRPEGRDDRMQRPYPSEPARAPPHRFRPGECANDHWKDFGQHFDRSAARLLDQRDIEVALFASFSTFAWLIDASPALLRNPWIAPS